jgi:signal transduction histidine kinase
VDGKPISEILQSDQNLIEAAVKELLHKGEWFGEISHKTKEGKTVIAQSRWTLLREENGKPKSVLVINTDITEKKQSEAKFLRVQRMENLGALAGGIAHDLNNALAPILIGAEMLREDLVEEGSRKLLDTMLQSAQRGADMVRQILSFSRGVSGAHVVLQLKHLLADMQKFTRSTFSPSIRLETRIANDLFPVLGDATQLHQVLLNLCVNARDAMPTGGTLVIEAKNVTVDESFAQRQVLGPHAMLTVSDTGHGIPADLMHKIFEPFFTTKELGKGTGLGLSTVMGIVKTHRGFMSVSSEVGRGTSFHVFLPAVEAENPALSQNRPTPPSGKGELILIVDDEKAILQMMTLTLEACNYRVLTAQDGIDALTVFEKHRSEITVVLTDMMMPNLTGPELVRRLRAIAPDLRIIGTSGLGSEAALNQTSNDFVRTFLRKPFNPEALLVKLREVLD